jgi:pimeloyl-ACP methyl ester carboxylesterase
MEQDIHFCTTRDNVRIAYATVGSGPPFVKAANWLNHLEADWKSPVWRHLLDEFSSGQTLVRYDERGNGLSDRRVDDFSLEAFVNDLESVVAAAGLERFTLLGISQGGGVAIAYAVRHPEKVSHLILFGAFSQGWRKLDLPPSVVAKRETQLALIQHSWGSENPATQEFFTSLVIPEGNPAERRSFIEMQRICASAENASRLFASFGEIDVLDLLPQVAVPTLVFHSRGDSVIGFDDGRRIAAGIPNARFVPLESNNHLLLSSEPAWHVFADEIRRFTGRARIAKDTVQLVAKHCPACDRVYQDETLNFCLEDGTPLLGVVADAHSDADPTQVFSQPKLDN